MEDVDIINANFVCLLNFTKDDGLVFRFQVPVNSSAPYVVALLSPAPRRDRACRVPPDQVPRTKDVHRNG